MTGASAAAAAASTAAAAAAAAASTAAAAAEIFRDRCRCRCCCRCHRCCFCNQNWRRRDGAGIRYRDGEMAAAVTAGPSAHACAVRHGFRSAFCHCRYNYERRPVRRQRSPDRRGGTKTHPLTVSKELCSFDRRRDDRRPPTVKLKTKQKTRELDYCNCRCVLTDDITRRYFDKNAIIWHLKHPNAG